jgi:hypothetical protein
MRLSRFTQLSRRLEDPRTRTLSFCPGSHACHGLESGAHDTTYDTSLRARPQRAESAAGRGMSGPILTRPLNGGTPAFHRARPPAPTYPRASWHLLLLREHLLVRREPLRPGYDFRKSGTGLCRHDDCSAYGVCRHSRPLLRMPTPVTETQVRGQQLVQHRRHHPREQRGRPEWWRIRRRTW